MPYSGASDPSIPDYVPSDKKAQWVKVFNSAYSACTKKGGSSKTCEGKAFKIANGVVKKNKSNGDKSMNWVDHILDVIKKALTGIDRSMSLGQLMQLTDYAMRESGSEGWLIDLYREDSGELFAISVDKGRLFRHSISATGTTVEVGEPQEVMSEFVATERFAGRNRIVRSADGKVRLLAVSCTSVLNKVGEIDGTELFDSFVENISRGEEYPYRTFYHLGKQFRTGQVEFLAREGNVLISSTVYDDSDLARFEIAARERDPEKWGDSIGYTPTSAPEIMTVADGIKIPVYRSGIIEEISTLPEDQAAAFFSSGKLMEVRRMNANQRKAFAELVGNPEEAEEWLEENVDDLNRSIAESGAITRAAEEDTTEDTPQEAAETEEVTETEEAEPQDDQSDEEEEGSYLVDEEVIRQIADHIIKSGSLEEMVARMTEPVAALTASVEELKKQIAEIHGALARNNKEVEQRLRALETSEEEKHETWSADLPRNSQRRQVTFRPRESSPPVEENPSLAEVAAQTLRSLK